MNRDVLDHLIVGKYETPEILGLAQVVRPGDRVLELGAGLGIITALAARAAAPGGRVLAFEANPTLLKDTHDFWAENNIDNVELRHAVLVPENAGTRMFHLAASFAESSLLTPDAKNDQGAVEVPAERLGDVIADFQPDVLLCDIEGAEAELIPALEAPGLRAAVIEFHPDRLPRRDVAEIYDALIRQGLYPEPTAPGGTVVIFTRVD